MVLSVNSFHRAWHLFYIAGFHVAWEIYIYNTDLDISRLVGFPDEYIGPVLYITSINNK